MTHDARSRSLPAEPIGPGPRRLLLLGAVLGAAALQAGCAGMAVTGAAVGALAVVDRRTLGAQTDDQSIEIKGLAQISEALPAARGISVTSYNRKVLLSGQAPSKEAKERAEKIISALPNVRGVFNELQIGPRVGLGTATSDTALTARVKTAMIDAKDVQSATIKVVTEAGVVYLMGLVTRAEGDRAAQVASRVSGVSRVVTVFEYLAG